MNGLHYDLDGGQKTEVMKVTLPGGEDLGDQRESPKQSKTSLLDFEVNYCLQGKFQK